MSLANQKFIFQLQFDQKNILYWAQRYPIKDDFKVEEVIAPRVRMFGYYTKPDFLAMCHWKSPRSKPKVESNEEEFIKEVTEIALTTKQEKLRIEILTLLSGVSWPTASVLLHYGYNNLYPILDMRALESLGVDAMQVVYNFELWWKYTLYCRELANETNISLRTLDRALWQYSKENER